MLVCDIKGKNVLENGRKEGSMFEIIKGKKQV